MKIKVYMVLLFLGFFACKTEGKKNVENQKIKPEIEMAFDKEKWSVKEGNDYPFRDRMLHDIVYNDTVRTLHKNEILELLGEPDRIDSSYLFYKIVQKRIQFIPLHTKTMVVKLSGDNTIEWIKIHE